MTCPSRKRSGGILALVAVAMTTLLALTGLVVDLGYMYVIRQKSQAAADAAALAAAYNIPNGTATQLAQATAMARLNNARGVDSTVVLSPSNGSAYSGFSGDATQVEATNTVTYNPFFLRLMGFSSFTVVTRAVGQYSAGASVAPFNPFSLGLFGNVRVNITGGINVDGFNSLTGNYASQVANGTNTVGQVGSNGDIRFGSSGATIAGNLWARNDLNFGGGVSMRNGDMRANRNISVSGSADFIGDLIAGGNVSLSSNGATINGQLHAGGFVNSGQNVIGNIVSRGNLNLYNGGAHYHGLLQTGGNLLISGTLYNGAIVNGTANFQHTTSQGNIQATGDVFIPGNHTGSIFTTGDFNSSYGRVMSGTVTVQGGPNSVVGSNALPPKNVVVTNPSLTIPPIENPRAPDVQEVTLPPINMTGVSASNNPTIIFTGNAVVNTTNNPPDFNLTTAGGSSATMPAGTYFFNSFTVNNKLVTQGNVVIYTRQLAIKNGGGSNITGGTAYFYVNGTTTVEANPGPGGMYGGIYAPNASISIGGASEVFGALVGDAVDITAGSRFHRDRGLGNPGMSGTAGAAAYRLTQ